MSFAVCWGLPKRFFPGAPPGCRGRLAGGGELLLLLLLLELPPARRCSGRSCETLGGDVAAGRNRFGADGVSPEGCTQDVRLSAHRVWPAASSPWAHGGFLLSRSGEPLEL
mmetsp:Transcript_33840/g.97264  ORF Transcript_33840/g.97264 Transcript_33840/m.97264 type:complete len:111 (+) Transcript_33840:2753-3085(+)